MSLNHHAMLCPRCHTDAVDMVAEPVVKHSPTENGWYGQSHVVTILMKCEHGHDFVFQVEAYKSRDTAMTELRDPA